MYRVSTHRHANTPRGMIHRVLLYSALSRIEMFDREERIGMAPQTWLRTYVHDVLFVRLGKWEGERIRRRVLETVSQHTTS